MHAHAAFNVFSLSEFTLVVTLSLSVAKADLVNFFQGKAKAALRICFSPSLKKSFINKQLQLLL